jgi:hypothetical protein
MILTKMENFSIDSIIHFVSQYMKISHQTQYGIYGV